MMVKTPAANVRKDFIFKNKQNQQLEVSITIKNEKFIINTQLNENTLNKKIFSSNYSFDEIKENNRIFFLCQEINDVLNQIELILKDNNKVSFIINQNQILLTISTNIFLEPEIIFELKEEKKGQTTKV